MTKPIKFRVHIDDGQGHAVANAKVNGILSMQSMDMGKTALKFGSRGNGDYEIRLKDVDMSGEWDLAIEAVQGNTHVKEDFHVIVSD